MRHRDDDELPALVIERRGGGFVLGLLVGAAVGLLLAPRSGAETQAELKAAARKLAEDVEDRMGSARVAAGERAEAVRGAMGAQAARARHALDAGRAAAADARVELRRRVDEAKATYRAGRAGDVPPAPPAADVVITEVSVERDPGDLAR
jgi:gas vesicle protein